MNREEAIAIIRKEYLCVDRDCDIERNCGKCDLMMPSKEPILEAYRMALKALDQEPYKVSEYDKDHIWYRGVQYISLRRFLEVKSEEKNEPCDNAIRRQDVLDLAKKGILVSNGNYESVCKAINELPSVNPQPCEDAIDRAEAIKVASGYCHPANIANELAKLPPVNPTKTGWIPVSERLPKIADVYRVTRYYPNNVMNPNYLVDACFFDGSNTWYNDNRINHERDYANNVIAWQENPEPYEPQERNGKK